MSSCYETERPHVGSISRVTSSFHEIKLRWESCTVTERTPTLVAAVVISAIAVAGEVMVVILEPVTFGALEIPAVVYWGCGQLWNV